MSFVKTLFGLSAILSTLSCANEHDNPAIAHPELGVVQISGVRPGCGFLISANGLLVTTSRLSNGSSVNVTLADGRRRVATFVEEDRDADVAVLKIAGDHYPFLSLSVADIEPVMRIRAVSGSGFTYGIFDRWENSGQTMSFTARVAPGDTGAPLLGDDGAVVGVIREPSSAPASPQLATPVWRVIRMLPAVVK